MSRWWGWVLLILLLLLLPSGGRAANPGPGQLLYTPNLHLPKFGIGYPPSGYPPLFWQWADDDDNRATDGGVFSTRPAASTGLVNKIFVVTDCTSAACTAGGGATKCVTRVDLTGASWIVGPCDGSGGGGTNAFGGLTTTPSTNTTSAMHVGTGASLDATGSGTLTASTVVCTACIDLTTEVTGALPLANLTDDNTTSGLCLLSGGAGGNPAYTTCPGGGGGTTAFGGLTTTPSTNTTSAMHVGTGASLDATGSGTLTASTVVCTACIDLTTEVTGILPSANGGTGVNAASTVALFNALSPLTTVGDLLTNDGTNDVRLPNGTAGQVLTADPAGANPKVKWNTLSAGSGTVSSGTTNQAAYYTGATTVSSNPLLVFGNALEVHGTTVNPSGGASLTVDAPTGTLTSNQDALIDICPAGVTIGAGGALSSVINTDDMTVTMTGNPGAPLGFFTFLGLDPLFVNQSGTAITMPPITGTVYAPGVKANNAAITMNTGLGPSFVGLMHIPALQVAGTGTGTVAQDTAVEIATMDVSPGWTETMRQGLHMKDFFSETNATFCTALNVPAQCCSGFHTGSCTAGAVTTQVGVDIDSLANAANNFSLRSSGSGTSMLHLGKATFGNLTPPTSQFELAGSTNPIFKLNTDTTLTVSTAGLSMFSGGALINGSVTLTGLDVSGSIQAFSGSPGISAVNVTPTFKNVSSTAITMGAIRAFLGAPTINADTQPLTLNDIFTLPIYEGISLIPTFSRTGTPTNTAQTVVAGPYIAGVIGAGWTITDWLGASINPPTLTGAATDLIGLDMGNMAGASTLNLSIRSAGGQMRHAGSAIFGSSSAAPSGRLEVDQVAGATPAVALSYGNANFTAGTTETRDLISFADSVTMSPSSHTHTLDALTFNPTITSAAVGSVDFVTIRGLNYTPTINSGTSVQNFGVRVAGTLTNTVAPAGFEANTNFRGETVVSSGTASVPPYTTTGAQIQNTVKFTAASTSVTTASVNGFFDASTAQNVTAGGTFTVTNLDSFVSGQSITQTAGTMNVTTRRGLRVNDFTKTGSPATATQVGVDIAALANATTNIGIRNASTTVSTPSASQTISAVGNTILCNATVVMISNTTGASITLTSSPTIADGVDGQMCTIINVSASGAVRDVVIPSNNIRFPAAAASLTLGVNDVITLVFSSTINDWVTVSRSDN